MSLSNTTAYVKQQYATSANLDARIALHQKYSTASEHFHDWLFAHVQLPDNARVLEIGCGSGALWERVRVNMPLAWKITLTDFSFGMVDAVRGKFTKPVFAKKTGLVNFPFSFAQSDAQQIPFLNESLDGIFANHMLYHVPDLDRALAEIRRVLKRGGNFYAATNGLAHLRELGDLVSDMTQQPFTTQTPERIFGLENGAALLARHFEIVTRDVHENNLRVTEVEPLVAYVTSGAQFTGATVNAAVEQEFHRRVQNEIDAKGAFHITKAVGMFVAS